MPSSFQKIIDEMEPLLQALQASTSHSAEDDLRNLPQKGVYVFYENGRAIYVGQSNRIRDRIREYGAKSSRHKLATLACKLMLEEMGSLRATLRSDEKGTHWRENTPLRDQASEFQK